MGKGERETAKIKEKRRENLKLKPKFYTKWKIHLETLVPQKGGQDEVD